MTTEYATSSISFAEHRDPITNEIAAVLLDTPGNGKAVIAYIHKEYEGSAKRSVYRIFDVDGNEIIPANYSLTQVKKEIRRKEDEFREQVALKTQALHQDFTEQERQRFKELRTLRSERTKVQGRIR